MKRLLIFLTPVQCISIICSLTNKRTILIYYINYPITRLYIYYILVLNDNRTVKKLLF